MAVLPFGSANGASPADNYLNEDTLEARPEYFTSSRENIVAGRLVQVGAQSPAHSIDHLGTYSHIRASV